MGIEPFTYSATQTWNGFCILDDVVGDSISPWCDGGVAICEKTKM